jgi:hypothetical protein
MGTKSGEVIWGGQIVGAAMRARRRPRLSRRRTAPRPRPGRSAWRATVDRRSRRRPSANASRRLEPARGRVQSLQDRCIDPAGLHPPAARHSDLETGSLIEVPELSRGPHRAAGSHDQAHRAARGCALQMGASERARSLAHPAIDARRGTMHTDTQLKLCFNDRATSR